jgi:hypothetical protein
MASWNACTAGTAYRRKPTWAARCGRAAQQDLCGGSTPRGLLTRTHGSPTLCRLSASSFRPHPASHSLACAPASSLQRHHLAREVFLTQLRDADSIDAVLRYAHVLGPREFAAGAACSALGEDVFVCEYEYDSAWQVGAVHGCVWMCYTSALFMLLPGGGWFDGCLWV